MQQRQRAILTVAAVVVGVLIVVAVAAQQLAPSPTPSQVTVVVSPSPAATGSAQASQPGETSSGTASAPAPSSSGVQLFMPGPGNTTDPSIPVHGRTLGDIKAPVTIDLYGDFRCSACYAFTEGGTAATINSEVVATGMAKVVWHDFLVIDLHDNTTASRDAANAAWCAADQDRFWTMHDWLYVNQSPTEDASAFSIDRLLAIGQVAGMDMSSFVPCVQQGTHDANLTIEQQSLPESVARNGTPSVMVNGKFVNASASDVIRAVKAAWNSSSLKPSAGG